MSPKMTNNPNFRYGPLAHVHHTEGFNAFDETTYGMPNRFVNEPQLVTITMTMHPSREAQSSGRLTFWAEAPNPSFYVLCGEIRHGIRLAGIERDKRRRG